MKFTSILGNSQKLDGGAMFGNAPKALWSRWSTPDEMNRIDLACRILLVEIEDKKLLFETGIGTFMPPDLRERYGIQESAHVLLDALEKLGISQEEITDIVLSHLHFDHAGGLLSGWQEEKPSELLFPHAQYYVGEEAWNRALKPHPRDRASFIPELNLLLEQSHRLVKLKNSDILHFGELEVRFFESEGHTPGMMCSDLRWNRGRLVFAADLIPGCSWVHLPITMGYDRYPECLIEEKNTLLSSIVEDKAWLFYTHDPEFALSKVTFNEERKKFIPTEKRPSLERELPS